MISAVNVKAGLPAIVRRVFAVGCAIVSAMLAVYSFTLAYAAATFAHDSLPGPAVLAMMAVAVALVGVVFGGVARALWMRRVSSHTPAADPRREPGAPVG